jgi:hypothetical protein
LGNIHKIGPCQDSGDLLMTQVCRSERETEEVSAGWEEAMIEKGWSEHVNDTAID